VRPSISIKPTDPRQVLTEADLTISRLLVERLRRQFPAYNLIDEESGVVQNGSAFTWVIDPIDGTSNFATGSPLYGSFIGLLEHGRPVAGGVGLPAFDQVFSAARGEGAFVGPRRLAPPAERPLEAALVACNVDGEEGRPGYVRRFGSLLGELALACRGVRSSNSGYDIGAVLGGAYDAVLFSNGKVWDFIGPLAVLVEAGYTCTRLDGTAFDFSQALAQPDLIYDGLLAAPHLHAPLFALVQQHLLAD
jgi:myo-inositol-1(or 4)-monophosphatase